MALATQCPHCQTTFRVANDQLKLRAGLVRCGACREVFNGIEHLVRPGHAASAETINNPASYPLASQHNNPSPAATIRDRETAASTASVAVPRALNPQPDVTTGTAENISVDTSLAGPKNYSGQLAASDQPAFGATEELSSIPKAPLSSPPFDALIVTGKDSTLSPTPASAPRSEPEDKRPKPSMTVGASPEYAVQKLRVTVPITTSPNVWHRHVSNTNSSDSQVSAAEDPLQRMTLFQIAPGALDDVDFSAEDDELDRLIDELQNRPWRGKKQNAPIIASSKDANVILGEVRDEVSDKISENNKFYKHDQHNPPAAENLGNIIAEPRFMQDARRKQRVGGVIRMGMWIGSALLLIILIGQASYTFRDQLAASVPQLKPVLQRACGYLGCRIGLPMNIDGITIDANDLQLIVPARNQFALSLLMRNRNSTVQAWPDIELTLNDASEKAIVRRVFTPAEYLPAAANATVLAQGFARNTEHSVKLTFELSQLKASGYRVYLFYP